MDAIVHGTPGFVAVIPSFGRVLRFVIRIRREEFGERGFIK
jgi:hypothetical protein